MSSETEYSIHNLLQGDENFLWDMLYQAIYIAPHESPPRRDILQSPDIAKCVKGWGKSGDFGHKVIHLSQNIPVGAIWVRTLCAVCAALYNSVRPKKSMSEK